MNICKLKRSTQIAIMTGAVEKTVTGTAPLTLSDSVAGNILDITINGRSVVSAGSIISVGDNGLTITTTDNTMTSTAAITTGLPIRGVSDTVRDKLICTANVKQVTKKCAEGDLSAYTWTYVGTTAVRSTFKTQISGAYVVGDNSETPKIISADFSVVTGQKTWEPGDISQLIDGYVYVIVTTDITNVEALNTYLTGKKIVYELAEPVTAPLTDAEISALTALSTYDPTTIISVTDDPVITVKYMGKNITRAAPKKRPSRKKK